LKTKKITWIGLLVTLSTLSIPSKTIASETNSLSAKNSQGIETRLARIAKTLKQREKELPESSEAREMIDNLENPEIARGWIKGYRGGFANGYRGGFVNRRWPDGGGFWNRRYY
jgi:rSAM-associated Gly-rich repeat protein